MAEKSDSNQVKKKKGRSPSYPGLDIQTALAKARELYGKEKCYQVDVRTAAGHWNYKFGTGISNITLAALKKYGFLIEEGRGDTRKVQLTDLARRIIIDDRDESEERDQLIFKAALTPKIHSDLYEKYNGDGLPSEKSLKFDLCANRAFTESGAEDFIAQFAKTLSYINSIKSDNIGLDFDDKGQEDEETKNDFVPDQSRNTGRQSPPPPPPSPGGNMKSIPIPMLDTDWPTLTGNFPMSEEQWDYMMGLLEKMKSQLVKKDRDEVQPDGD